ncbi:MAG TPA: CHRD domain-containing protein, partial [Longimicrobiales bacterium]|nr:CHRD domain-containing protein [Longimicrobiales bacterium]
EVTMRGSHRSTTFALLPLAALFIACGDAGTPDPDALLAPGTLPEARGGPAPTAESNQFIAHLTGAEEVPAVDTRAQGQATFRLSGDGSELSYRLIVANIEDVLMAHIHLGPAGVNRGVIAWLYPEDGPPPVLIEGRIQGVLATGVITADDLTGFDEVTTMEQLVDRMRTGGAYVNVHTTANLGGEIRGQIR